HSAIDPGRNAMAPQTAPPTAPTPAPTRAPIEIREAHRRMCRRSRRSRSRSMGPAYPGASSTNRRRARMVPRVWGNQGATEERRVVVMDRILGDKTLRMRDRLLSARLGNLDRQNERLRNEVSVLHSQLDHEREEHEELRDALRSKPKEVSVRKPGLVRIAVIGGGAYLLGAHAGRERYEEVMR